MKEIKFAKPKRIKKLSYYKKKAWDAFSLWVRKSNEVDGMIACYTCGKKHVLKEMSAGHAIGGRNNQILFDERIVKPQCAGCNVWGRGQYQIFAYKLIKELGMGVFEEILANAKKEKKYTPQDFDIIYGMYKGRLEQL